MCLSLETEMTPKGIVCTHPALGKVATITRILGTEHVQASWQVEPYSFSPAERGSRFVSLRAAEFYAVALAHEMHETRKLEG